MCGRLHQKKKYLVSAFDNNGSISYPAAFETVIGVTTGNECYHNHDFYIVNNSMVNVCAKGRAQRLVWLRNSLLVGSGNSYACAHITGILSLYINSHDPKDILTERCLGSIDVGVEKKSVFVNPVAKYKKAVAFPFNKEMHSIIRFHDQLRFELVDIYDLKYSAHVGAFTNDLLKSTCPRNYCIRNIEDINWDSFDTFILGHTDELFQILDRPGFKQSLINQIIDHGKNLYAYDDLSGYDIPENRRDLVYYPKITQADVPVCPFGKLYRQGKPILGVFGTSSRQGKFTLQLKLRTEFLNRGYRVAQIGTEPNALLFGMDIVFPVGYHSSVSINRKDTVAYLNNAIHEISSDADIVLVGGQSGTVIRDEGNLDNYNFTQVDFLYATQPDAVILCINVFDDLEIIHRTKRFIEAAIGCRVVALVAFPFHYKKEDTSYQQLIALNDSEFQMYKETFMKQFELPVYLMSDDSQIQVLMEQTIGYFSQS